MLDFKRILEESREIGLTAYDGIEPGDDQLLPQAYLNKYLPVMKERIVLAGFRLAYMIQTIFGNQK